MAIQNIGYKKYRFDTILMIIVAFLTVEVIVDKSLKYFYGASFYMRLAANVGIVMGAIIVYYLITLKKLNRLTWGS